MINRHCFMFLMLFGLCGSASAQTPLSTNSGAKLVPIAPAWAGNIVNVVIFRRNAVTTNGDTQFAAFYDQDGRIVLAKRKLDGTDWQMNKTQHAGDVRDAHNAICIAMDGSGVLHMVWAHHNQPLQYCRAVAPGSLEVGEKMSMTGLHENRVTYPEFHSLPDGGLLCIYRDGASGNGNLVMDRYDVTTQTWRQVHENLIDGQGKRNAYWQAAVDQRGTIHLSWVWRESPDVASNHDLCYARSMDGGQTWQKTSGENYALPITVDGAEYAAKIPQAHELINQTSMTADSKGRPYIATYWRDEGSEVPQYRIVYHDGTTWHSASVGKQTLPFRLGGAGTKRLPLSRPQILADASGPTDKAYLLFRDEGRDNRISLAICDDLIKNDWRIQDLTAGPVGQWEPTYDLALWNQQKVLHTFVQKAEQHDGEGVNNVPAEMAYVLEWKP
jgi:hypothetical protein